MSRARMNRLPDEVREQLNRFPGGTAAPIQDGAILCTAEAHKLAAARQPGTVVIWTPMLHLTDHGAVFRFTSEFKDRTMRITLAHWDYYLNTIASSDGVILRNFSVSPTLIHHLYDLALNYSYSKQINVGVATRTDMQRMIVRAVDHDRELMKDNLFDYKLALMEVQDTYGYK